MEICLDSGGSIGHDVVMHLLSEAERSILQIRRLQTDAARLEMVRRIIDFRSQTGRPHTSVMADIMCAIDGTSPIPRDLAEDYGL